MMSSITHLGEMVVAPSLPGDVVLAPLPVPIGMMDDKMEDKSADPIKEGGELSDTESESEEKVIVNCDATAAIPGIASDTTSASASSIAAAAAAAAAISAAVTEMPPQPHHLLSAPGCLPSVAKAAPQKRTPKKCEHGRQKSQCKDCKGPAICEHNWQKRLCKECGGSAICPHKRIRSQCIDCGGSGICPHQRRKSRCKECGGSGVCQHGRQRTRCKDCGGPGICEHGRRKSQCKDCGGSSFCIHQRRKSRCKECGGSGMCAHGRQKSRCKDCGGSGICEHGRRKSQCKDCGGSAICVHDRRRSRCKECAEAGISQSPVSYGMRTCVVEDGDPITTLSFGVHQEPLQKRQKTVLTLSASLVQLGDAATQSVPSIASAVAGTSKSQLCSVVASAPLPECALDDLSKLETQHAPPPPPPPPLLHLSVDHQQLEQPAVAAASHGIALQAHGALAAHLGIGELGAPPETPITPMGSVAVVSAMESGWLTGPGIISAVGGADTSMSLGGMVAGVEAAVGVSIGDSGMGMGDLVVPPPSIPPPPDPTANGID